MKNGDTMSRELLDREQGGKPSICSGLCVTAACVSAGCLRHSTHNSPSARMAIRSQVNSVCISGLSVRVLVYWAVDCQPTDIGDPNRSTSRDSSD